jgi:delta14-sterol reductase
MEHFVLPVTLQTLTTSFYIVLAWIVVLFLFARFLPGIHAAGAFLQDGTRKSYKLNGLPVFLLTTLAVILGTSLWQWSLTPVAAHFWSLFIAANMISFLIAGILYYCGKENNKGLSGAKGFFPDFWLGTRLHPSLFGIDLKTFAYQPSLLGTMILNTSFAYIQYEMYGLVTIQMGLYILFWWIYLFTHYLTESCIVTMWDAVTEKFGFMLVWGNFVYVPFFYSLPGWVLVYQKESITPSAAFFLTLLFILGITLFREANLQKHRFKQNNKVKIWGQPAQTIGGRLLVSGWWGWGRKLNYTGEILVYICFALTAGFSSPVPYLLPLSLIILLVQRSIPMTVAAARNTGLYGMPIVIEYPFVLFHGERR